MKITNYQKQQLKMLFGKDTKLNLTFEQAEKKINKKCIQIEKDKEDFMKNNDLSGSNLFKHWSEE